MNFKITTLGDYLKGHAVTEVVSGRKIIHRRNGCLIVGCAYCRKTGLDCDGLSKCPVCRGKKKVLVKEPVTMCAFCKGKGSSNGFGTVCRVCHGKALITIEGNIDKCIECNGKGRIRGTDLMCIKCGGKGVTRR